MPTARWIRRTPGTFAPMAGAAGILLAMGATCVQGAARLPPATQAIAFASFGPLDADVFVANGDGSDARAFLSSGALELNASFSHDGAWVVFTSNRAGSYDIYRAHPDGSALERLTDDPAYDDQAALSPDGRLLAFVSSRSGQADIWILDLSSRRLRNLTNHPAGDFRPAWSPDGQRLAFSSDRDSERPRLPSKDFTTRHSTQIYVVRVDGSGLQRVTEGGTFAGSPSWSGDGSHLVFYSADLQNVASTTGAKRGRGTTQIETLDLASGIRTLATSGEGEKWSPSWLADGRIGYVTAGTDGGVEFGTGPAGARGEFSNPHWSANGRRMVFHRDVDKDWPPHRAYHSRDSRFALVRTGIFPSYSPDGRQMVSNDRTAGIMHNGVMRMDADGSHGTMIYSSPELNVLAPAWSHHGERIAFAVGNFFQTLTAPANADIAVVGSDGSQLQTLTDGKANYAFPSWSPDDRELVYRVAGEGNNALRIVEVATKQVRTLIAGPAHYNFPSWSPAGGRIAFTADIDGDYEIYSIRPDGSDLVRLTDSPGNDAHSAWSPDGQWIAFSSARGGFKDESVLHKGNPQPYGEIYVMRSDGSGVRMLTDDPFEKATPTWIPRLQ